MRLHTLKLTKMKELLQPTDWGELLRVRKLVRNVPEVMLCAFVVNMHCPLGVLMCVRRATTSFGLSNIRTYIFEAS